MARRFKDPSAPRTALISVRSSTSLKKRLDQARIKNKRTFSEEVIERLETSFLPAQDANAFGGKKAFDLFLKMAILTKGLSAGLDDGGHHWLEDPRVFKMAKQGIDWLL